MVTKQQLVSADTFWSLIQSGAVEQRTELIEGEIRDMAPAGEEHGIIAGHFFGHIWQFVTKHKSGRVTAAETGYVVHKNPDGKDTVLAPDVGFTTNKRLLQSVSSKFAPYAPDLAVEVVSPNDKAYEIQEKVSKYLQYGTQLIWVVYPKTEEVVVHQANASTTLSREDTLSAPAILPGFELPLNEIFPE